MTPGAVTGAPLPAAAGTGAGTPALGQAGSAAPMTDILPIRPPVEINLGPPLWVWVVLGLMLLAAAVAVWYVLRRKDRPAGVPGPPPVPPHVTAAALLRELDAAAPGLTDREYYFELTGIVKGYIEDRFEVPAREMTVGEIVPFLDAVPPAEGLRELLLRAEPVKFAGQAAGEGQRRDDLVLVEGAVRGMEEEARRREAAVVEKGAEGVAADVGVGGQGA